MSFGLTKDQIFAARPDLNVWVEASAGTGKTHVLTARVLRMMVRGTPPGHILGLTYTKAAAAEMAARVYKILGQWAMIRETELAAEIFKSTGEKASDQALQRARTLFATVLDIPGGLKIQTIHSFCQSLLKRFPLEAGLPPHFAVMEERTSGEYLKQAMDEVMLAATEGGDASLKEAFDHIATREAEGGFEGLVGSFLGKRRKVLKLLQIYSGIEGLISATYRALGADPRKQGDDLLQIALDDQSFDKKGLGNLSKIALAGAGDEQKFGETLTRFLAAKENRVDLFPNYRDVFLTQKGTPRKTILKKATLDAHPLLEDIIGAEKARLFELQQTLNLQEVARDTAALIRLGSAILARYQKAKEAHGLLDYDDLILKTSSLLEREGITPWILYKLDGGIDHILVDEAQDTNQIQWQLVEALSDEFFSGLGSREGLLRTVFAVGDPKQSIYRFQGAEPKAFEEAKVRLAKKARDAGLALEDCVLNTSYRSTGAVLKAVDAVFLHPGTRNGIVRGDQAVTHLAHRLGQHGLIEVWPPERPEAKDTPKPGWRLPNEQKFVHTPAARLAEKIAGHIEQMITSKEHLKSRGRAVRYGDFLVLVKTRDDFMDHLIRELKGRNIPVAGSDRMVLADQLAIQDLVALAGFTLLPGDDYNLACVLKGPLLNFDDDDLLTLAPGRTGSLWRALEDQAKTSPKYRPAVTFLKTLLAMLGGETPFDFFSRVLGPLEGRKRLVRRLGFEVNDPLDEFLSLALEFEQNHTPSLQGFLKWFGAGKTQIKRDMERGKNEVRIMTIHGAKGLEAPVVYLPDTYKVARKRRTDLLEIPPRFQVQGGGENLLVWARAKEMHAGPCKIARDVFLDEERAEHNRLLYVALTRAEDRLYICGWTGKSTPKDPTWYGCIREALEDLEGVEKIDTRGELALLRLESPQTARPKPDDKKMPGRAEAISLPAWASSAAKKEAGMGTLVRPSRQHEQEIAFSLAHNGEAERARARGNIIHKLLEVLPGLPAEKREGSARAYLAQKDKALTRKQQDDIWNKVKGVLEHPQYSFIFGPGSRGEVALAGIVEGNFVSAQIDRLVVEKDRITLVDYKSDRRVPETVAAAPREYIQQVGLYRELLKDLYPGREIRAALLWTEDCTWMIVPGQIIKK
ncbi:MAG: double-strand break repair helicase AddA [Proteobacteria bacterium]|nr:double-strand break repair helicase AddA [Pseudomonadota bacterium]